MQDNLISILTPFKNTEHFLCECIESIQSQTYGNWELILVDDNSEDNSYNIVENYAKKDARAIQGADSGFIKFGSRVDLFLPLNAEIKVELNQKVRGGESIIAEMT